jgi:hypothetical protein
MIVWIGLTAWLVAVPVTALALSALAARRPVRSMMDAEIPEITCFSLQGASARGLPCELRRRPGNAFAGAQAARTRATHALRV